jgi:hypothetical protein
VHLFRDQVLQRADPATRQEEHTQRARRPLVGKGGGQIVGQHLPRNLGQDPRAIDRCRLGWRAAVRQAHQRVEGFADRVVAAASASICDEGNPTHRNCLCARCRPKGNTKDTSIASSACMTIDLPSDRARVSLASCL